MINKRNMNWLIIAKKEQVHTGGIWFLYITPKSSSFVFPIQILTPSLPCSLFPLKQVSAGFHLSEVS